MIEYAPDSISPTLKGMKLKMLKPRFNLIPVAAFNTMQDQFKHTRSNPVLRDINADNCTFSKRVNVNFNDEETPMEQTITVNQTVQHTNSGREFIDIESLKTYKEVAVLHMLKGFDLDGQVEDYDIHVSQGYDQIASL